MSYDRDKICIVLGGYAKAGKGETAKVLERNYGFEIVRNAGFMKYVLATYIGCPVEDLTNPATKHVYRDIMQDFGTEVLRDYHERFPFFPTSPHAKVVVREWQERDARIVVEDSRFLDEAEAFQSLKEHGWIVSIWAIDREASGLHGAQAMHRSETSIAELLASPLIEARIDNNAPLETGRLEMEVALAWQQTITPKIEGRRVRLPREVSLRDNVLVNLRDDLQRGYHMEQSVFGATSEVPVGFRRKEAA